MTIYEKYIKNMRHRGFGIIEGRAKNIITFLNLYDNSKNQLYKKRIDTIIEDIASKKDKIKIDSINLWNGVLGLSLALDMVSLYFNINEYHYINKKIYKNLIPVIEFWLDDFNTNNNLDYIYGLSGVILYIGNHSIAKLDDNLIKKLENKIKKLFNESILDKFVLSKKSDIYYLDSKYKDNEKYIILGIAHGITGFLISINSIILLVDDVTREKILSFNKLIEKIFIENFIDSNTPLKIPISLKILSKDNNIFFDNTDLNINELSWCYGIVGIGIYVIKILKNEELKRRISHEIYIAIKSILKKNPNNIYEEDLCICHGYSGIFYFYNFMCSNGEDSNLLMNYLENSLQNKDYKNDFLIGHEGIILTIMALKNNKRFIGDFLFGY